ncbi:disease resistance protein RPP13-like [Carex rostrata]
MAETIVNLVLVKLADALVQEALILHGVQEKVKWVQDQLEWIQCFLKDAETKSHKDNRVKKWVNDVQEVAYLIEDILEVSISMNLMAKHKIAKKIDQVQKRLHEISENTKTYGIIEGLNETSSVVEQHTRPFVNPDIDELEVVGLGVDMKTIVDQLIDTNITRRAVISIIGAGGSGKTTLAKKVYKSAEVKRHFDISMWSTISQEYKLIDILIKMLEEIQKVETDERKNGEQYFIAKLNKCLSERKYLIVLDDVWLSNVWTDQLQSALPDAHNGSRVLITSRFNNIAEEMDRISKPYMIQPLNEEESKQLLLKKIFPNQFANECPSDLIPLATQFSKKCGGWPLPLVVLGGFLSRKNPNYITWDEEMQRMDWQTDCSNFTGVISTSYEHLPIALKPCFMYFGAFPEDYQIKASTLIQLWIAEGFIRQERTKLLEDVAESYLQELVQRCMVQVSSRSCTGKIKYCHMHDLLRDLAVQKAKDDNFLTVLSKNDANLSCHTSTRRVALHNYSNKIREHAFTNLRSLINFGDVPNYNRFGTLRVLHIKDLEDNRWSNYSNHLGLDYSPTALKYFGLENRCSRINAPFSFFNRYPLTYMKNIQTVRALGCTSHEKLPRSFWGNQQLRHINLSFCYNCRSGAVMGPRTAVDLPNLLTLKNVRVRQDWVVKLPHFPCIRKLGIDIPVDVAWEPLINLLSNLNYLGSLHLRILGMDKHLQITFPDCIFAFKNHNRLHSFKLIGGTYWRLKEVIDCTLFPPNLVKLKLCLISFEEDPMPQLEKLPKLKVLTLDGEIKTEKKTMICSRGGFGCLQKFHLDVRLIEWKIEEGAMPVLNQLILGDPFWYLQVPDLQYLPNILECTVLWMDAITLKMREEYQRKTKHIPSVIFKGTR